MVPHGAPSDLHWAGVEMEMRPVSRVGLPAGASTDAPHPDTQPSAAYDARGPRWYFSAAGWMDGGTGRARCSRAMSCPHLRGS